MLKSIALTLIVIGMSGCAPYSYQPQYQQGYDPVAEALRSYNDDRAAATQRQNQQTQQQLQQSIQSPTTCVSNNMGLGRVVTTCN